jgi:formylglycine-generating enzyme required for sulfatase activity
VPTEILGSAEKDPVIMVEIPGGVIRLGQDEPPLAPPAPDGAVSATSQGGRPPQVADNGPLSSPLAREVRVSPFLIDLTEVTRAHYARFLEETHYRPPWVAEPWAEEEWNWDVQYTPALARHPVVLTSWYDATEYCAWAGKRLPTEAEWQIAALGPAALGRVFPWGGTYDGQRLNHGMDQEPIFDESDGYRTTSPVGAFPEGASPYGLLDAFGNAWEWTSDLRTTDWQDYGGREDGNTLVDPHTRGLGFNIASRGGSYYLHADRGAPEKGAFLAETRRKTSGFRCARSLP